MFYKILMVLTIIATTFIIVLIINVNHLLQYKICEQQVVTELSKQCKDIIYGQV